MIPGSTDSAPARTGDAVRATNAAHAVEPGPRVGRARPMAADERRQMIIDSVIPLVLEHGVEVTTRQIAEAAGIAEGTVFRVFEDKNDIIDAAVDRVLDPTDVLEAIANIDRDLPLDVTLEMVVTFLRARVQSVVEFMGALGPRDHARHAQHGPEHRPPLHDASEAIAALLERHRDQIRFPVATAVDYIRMLVFGTSMPYLRGPQPEPSALTDFILRGIAAEKE